MRIHPFVTTFVAIVLIATAGFSIAFAAGSRPAGGDSSSDVAKDYAVVRLVDPPIASYTGDKPGLPATKPAPGEKVDLESAAAQKYSAYLAGKHDEFKKWLASKAPKAEVLQEYQVVYNGLAIALHGTSLTRLRDGPGVALVSNSWLYRPTMNVSPGLIEAPAVWAELGVSIDVDAIALDALKGISVGVIDTGIRDTHPFIAPCRPVPITHQVFFTGDGLEDPDSLIVFDHGTHVAGTIGGCPIDGSEGLMVPGSDDPVTFDGTLSGVAPGIALHDYNVFPGFGVGFVAFGGSALTHDVIEAIERAVADGMDVINLSLGGGVQGPNDELSEAVNGAADAGVVPAVAAGNSGPGDHTIESPGNARGALTAGASTNPHFLGIHVTRGLEVFGAAISEFANFDPPVTADYTVTNPADGCATITTDLNGKIALIDRGTCTFTTKIRNAQAAGAIGVIIANQNADDPFPMGHDDTDPFPTIPAAMVSRADGTTLKPMGTVTVDGTSFHEFLTDGADFLADFSSRGPTPFDFRVKPDVTAPGVNVLSSVFDDKFDFFAGTSMATPHVAGAASLLLALHDDWSPDDVKSALVTAADRTVENPATEVDAGVLARGGGRINLATAMQVPATLAPASVSFGLFSGNVDVFATREIVFRNVFGDAVECTLVAVGDWPLAVSPASFTMAEGGSATVTVALDGGRTITTDDYEGDIEATCDGVLLRAPWWFRVDRTGGFSQGSPFSLGTLPGFTLSVPPAAYAILAGSVLALATAAAFLSRRRE